MAGKKYRGSLGCDTNQPAIDAGTNCLAESSPPGIVGPVISAAPVSPLEANWNRIKDWFSEAAEAGQMLTWWVIGSPSLGLPNGDLEFGPGDKATEHMRNTAAYQEAVIIYQEWLNSGQPAGELTINGTECQFVPGKGYFYVKGRTGRGQDGGWNTEPLVHPIWGFTGNFSIRFTESGFPSEGYVNVEIENYTSLPSYFHGIDNHNPLLDRLYTKRSGVPILSRSRQVYRFNTYIARNSAPAQGAGADAVTHKVVSGDSLSALAKAYYNDMDLWPVIFDRNQDTIGSNADRIKAGQSLLIPAKQKLTPDQIKRARQTARLRAHLGAIKVAPLR
jgi:hypothetical protein